MSCGQKSGAFLNFLLYHLKFDIRCLMKQPCGARVVVNALISMPLSLPRRVLLGAGLILSVAAPVARAQQAAPAAQTPVAQTPADLPANAAPVDEATANNAAQRQQFTPEERRQQIEEKLRALMINLGVRAAPTQDAILDYLAQDETSHATLREAEKKLMTGLRRDVPPERMRDLLADYRGAIEADRDRRAMAQRNLDARIGYSLEPRLESVLWLMGVLGESASKLPTSALIVSAPPIVATAAVAVAGAPTYGPPFVPKSGARGDIVGTVIAKGLGEAGEHWLEIRDDSGASERYAALWRDDLNALDPEMEKLLNQTQLSARVRVQWVWQQKRRALKLQPESATD